MTAMMPEERSKLIRLTILRVLDQCAGYLLGEQQLFTQVNFELRPAAATTEFRSNLDAISALRAVSSVRPEIGGGLQWKITDQGRAILAENI